MTNIIEVENKIITLRDQQVILDSDVAELYGVQTKEINQAVRNNPEKFPQGYIFQLENQEFKDLRSKFLTTKYQRIYLGAVKRRDTIFKVKNFDLKESWSGTTLKIPSQSLHRKRPLYVGDHSEKSAGGGDHDRDCGSVCKNEGAVEGYHTGSAAG